MSPLSDPARQPHVKGLLFRESLLTKDFSGDQHFFRDEQPPPTPPSSAFVPNDGDPATTSHRVPHEDAPAFSDIATTVTVAATSPITTVTTAASISGRLVSVARKGTTKDMDVTAEKATRPTTQALTTPVLQTTTSPISIQGHTPSKSDHKLIRTESTLAPQALTTTSVMHETFGANDSAAADGPSRSSSVTTRKSQPATSGDEETTTSTITTTVITTIQSTGKQQQTFLSVVHHVSFADTK